MDVSSLDRLAPALVALQADLKPVEKSAANPFFKSKYAPLPEVMQSVQPLLAKHKLAVSQFPTHLEDKSALRTILLHESGQYIEDITPLLLVKDDPQAQGSAMTYARRYGVMAVLGMVADEDDDGNAASSPQKPVQRSTSTPTGSPDRVPTQKQLDFAYTLLEKAGYSDEAIKARMAKVKTAEDASELIEKVKEGL